MPEMDAIYDRVGGLYVHKKSVVACCRRLTSSGRVQKRSGQVWDHDGSAVGPFGVA